jgi:FeS assembly SUF system protein
MDINAIEPTGEPVGPGAPAANTDASPDEGGVQDHPLMPAIVEAMKRVFDPEIPVDIYELGLIYDVSVAEDSSVKIKMTLTAPACPAAGELPGEVERSVASVDGVNGASVELVWEPMWNPSLMSEEAKLALNMY